MLEIRNLTAGYILGQPILHNFNMHLNAGEKIGITGANGGGKSTLCGAIMGTVPFIEGDITWRKQNLINRSTYERNKLGIACFLQGGRVFRNMTVEDNLLAARLNQKKERHRDIYKELRISDLPVLSLQKSRKTLAGNLSGGERHILAFLMVLLSCPDMSLLIADEPSAGVSEKVQSELLELLSRYFRTIPTALIMIEQNIKFLDALVANSINIDNP